MDPPYLYKLPSGSTIYRATTINKEGRWYALSLEDAFTYGEIVTEYKTKTDLNLINITSLTFHNDFMDRLNVLFPGVDHTGIDHTKLMCMIPLGLFNFESQNTSLGLLNVSINHDLSKWNHMLQLLSHNLHDRHRFSEHTLDTKMVCVLEQIYGNYYDGYISPIRWPTKMHGHFFPRELCFFKLGNVVEEKEHKRPHFGGGNTINASEFKFDVELAKKNIEKMNETIRKMPVVFGWNTHTDDAPPCTIKGGARKTRKQRRGRQ